MRMAFRDITQGGNTWKVRSDPLKSLITNILNSHNVDHCRNCLRSTLKQYISLGNSLEKDRPCATSWQDRIFKVTVLLLPLYAGKVPSSPLLLTHYLFSLHPIKKKSPFIVVLSGNISKADRLLLLLLPAIKGQLYSSRLASLPPVRSRADYIFRTHSFQWAVVLRIITWRQIKK